MKKARRGKQALYPDMEKKLYDWITDQRSRGYIITSLHIRLQAQKICKNSSFKASNEWAQRFMGRHGLSLCQKTKIAEKLPKNLEDQFLSYLYN